jgi:hypothetical protein
MKRKLGAACLASACLAFSGLLFAACATPGTKPAASPKAAEPSAKPEKKRSDINRQTTNPEVSFPYRRAPRSGLLIASLHEPLAKGAAAKSADAPATTPAAMPEVKVQTALPPEASSLAEKKAEAPLKVTAPKAAPPKAIAPTTKTEAKAKAKDATNGKSVDPKNAPSSVALSVTSSSEPEKKPDIARNFSVVEGSRFEVPFEGTGWTYLGESAQKEGIAYDSKRFEGTSLVFILNPTKAGDFILRFQRQDALRGLSYEELVGVSVAAKPAALPKVASPSPAAPSAKALAASAGATSPAAAQSTSAAPTVAASSLSTPEAALSLARSELEADRPKGALEALGRLLLLAPDGTDEAFVLFARALEKNGPQKDIKQAYAYYKKIRDDYPESPFWDEASARVDYIERHYFDIR